MEVEGLNGSDLQASYFDQFNSNECLPPTQDISTQDVCTADAASGPPTRRKERPQLSRTITWIKHVSNPENMAGQGISAGLSDMTAPVLAMDDQNYGLFSGSSQHYFGTNRPGSPLGSEGSWNDEDESDFVYFEMEQRLRSFILAGDHTDLTTQHLTSSQRRVIHSMAHLMHLGHETMKSDGKHCRMRIFKKTKFKLSSSKTTQPALPALSDIDMAKSVGGSWQDSTASFSRQPNHVVTQQAIYSRYREPKLDDGYPCRFSDCRTMFNRACDRKKHEKRHEPKANHPYRCPYVECNKTFMYPKDLRRHQRVHEKKLPPREEPLSTDDVFTDSSMSSFSRRSSIATSTPSAFTGTSMAQSSEFSDEEFTPRSAFDPLSAFLGIAPVKETTHILSDILADLTALDGEINEVGMGMTENSFIGS